MPEISVLIPAFNCENYVARCLDSVLGQSFSDIEVIVVDDGSTDGTLGIINEYAARDRRLKVVVHHENSGVLWARKTLIESASGTFMMFVDSDDEILPDACERLHRVALDTGAAIVAAGYEWISKDGTVVLKSCELPYGDDSYGFAKAMAMGDLSRFLWGKLYRRDLFTAHDILFRKHHNACEDEFLSYQVALYVKKVVCIRDPVYKYYYNPTSLTRVFHLEKNMRDIIETKKMNIRACSPIGPDVKKQVERDAIKTTHYWIKSGGRRNKVMKLVEEHGLNHLFTLSSLVSHLGLRKGVTYFLVMRFGFVSRILYGRKWEETK
ncbi:MAG: glycosyltransferase family 2 protein [Bacteroidales bacterium]|nr:glycosyltransferase family 2 protein [Bacteroidales bacterium]